MPLKLEQSMIKSGHTSPFSGEVFEQLNVQGSQFERLKSDDIDQDSGLGLDLASLQRSDISVNISPESIGANRCNDQTSSPTTAGYRLPVQTPTSTDPGENHFGKSVPYTKILVNMYKYYYRATIR
jgi:hypothetical protein